MILKRLQLKNFCLFRGDQTFDLETSLNPRRPVILFGGMNGGGKTTIFDAIQLALYGARARCSKITNGGYESLLAASVNHSVSPEEGAAISLVFSAAMAGTLTEYDVRREWTVRGTKVRERLVVSKDGVPDQSLTRQWPQIVEELIPLEVAQLFFFDGEKIRALAEDTNSSEALASAIRALLGLDVVERLIADTGVLQARLAKHVGPPEGREAIEELSERRKVIRSELSRLLTARAELENERLAAESELSASEESFAKAGGQYWVERDHRRNALVQLESRTEELERQLLTLAASDLPLTMVSGILQDIADQDEREKKAVDARIICDALAGRDQDLLSKLSADADLTEEQLQRLSDLLEQDRRERLDSTPAQARHSLSDGARSHLLHLQSRRLATLLGESSALLIRTAEVAQEREQLERLLAATPDDERVHDVLNRFKKATSEVARLNEAAEKLDADISSKRAEIEEVERSLERHVRTHAEIADQRDDATRIAALTARTRDTMQEFLGRATARKIDRLSAAISDAFRYLIRKDSLVERIQIDPDSFSVTLFDAKGRGIPRHRLSEGEKQIFAISMLWGLAQASSRPLPMVIDTPMARLDSSHRRNLVARYFPSASHQVLILSTDTEVDCDFYQMLKPSVARSYHLDYDQKENITVGREGYFSATCVQDGSK